MCMVAAEFDGVSGMVAVGLVSLSAVASRLWGAVLGVARERSCETHGCNPYCVQDARVPARRTGAHC